MTAKPKIRVTRKLPREVEVRLEREYTALLSSDDRVFTPGELLAAAQGCDGLLVTPADKLAAEVIRALPASVRIIASYSVGYDHIDVPEARTRGLAVTNTPDVLTDATADIAMLLLLGAARGASWGDRMVRENRWKSVSLIAPLGHDVTGRRLGILGMGRIGQALAGRARGFDLAVSYHNRRRLPSDLECGARYVAVLDEMLPDCDFLSVCCASTPLTRGMVNERFLSLLPVGAILINTARGDIVDDDALIGALASGRLAAAGLDVFRNEPNIDPRYRTLDNVFLLPHLGSATHGTRIAMGMRAVDNLDRFFRGERPADLIA
jgi:glyoxylate reductase